MLKNILDLRFDCFVGWEGKPPGSNTMVLKSTTSIQEPLRENRQKNIGKEPLAPIIFHMHYEYIHISRAD